MSYANTVLLLPMNGANGGTSFPDYSRHNRTVTAFDNAQTSTAQFKFYDSSLILDGSGDYLSVQDDTLWRFNPAGFNVSFWVRPAAVNQFYYLVTHKTGTATGWFVFMNAAGQGGMAVFNTSSGDYIKASGAHGMSAGTWYHFEVDWDGTTLRFFIDGSSVATSTTIVGTLSNASDALIIGRDPSTPTTRDFNGHMADLRITRESIHVANFTPPGKLIGTLSNQGAGGQPVKDDTGTAAVRTIIVVPRNYSVEPRRVFLTTSDGSGNFSLSVPKEAEFSDIDNYSVIALDDTAGTTYNDLILGRAPTV